MTTIRRTAAIGSCCVFTAMIMCTPGIRLPMPMQKRRLTVLRKKGGISNPFAGLGDLLKGKLD